MYKPIEEQVLGIMWEALVQEITIQSRAPIWIDYESSWKDIGKRDTYTIKYIMRPSGRIREATITMKNHLEVQTIKLPQPIQLIDPNDPRPSVRNITNPYQQPEEQAFFILPNFVRKLIGLDSAD